MEERVLYHCILLGRTDGQELRRRKRRRRKRIGNRWVEGLRGRLERSADRLRSQEDGQKDRR